MTRAQAIARLLEQLGDAPNRAHYLGWLSRQSDEHLAQLVGEVSLARPDELAQRAS